MPHGFGLLICPTNDTYEGYWYMQSFHGYGVFTFANGNIYEGEHKNTKRQGHGVHTWTDGRKYDGPWKKDLQHGICTYRDENGQITKREYREGIHVRTIETLED